MTNWTGARSNFRTLLVVELVALAALLLVALALAALAALESSSQLNPVFGPAASAWLLFSYTLIIGVAPALLIGAPGYLLLLRGRKANWLAILSLGAAPGIALLFVATDLGLWATGCGLAVATITHLACRRLISELKH